MELNCPKCGVENWLENQNRCLTCGAVLRRCADCGNLRRADGLCTHLNIGIDDYEAANPGILSNSTNCTAYQPMRAELVRPAARHSKR